MKKGLKNNNVILKSIHIEDQAQALLIVLFFSQLFLQNGIYLFAGTACLTLALYRLQTPFKPSVFTIICFYHFIQIAANIWLSNYLGKDLDFRSDHMAEATIVSFIGLLFLFGPVVYYQNRLPYVSISTLKKYADQISIKKTFNLYLIAFFVTNTLGGMAFALTGLTQIVFSAINLKWFIFILFGFQVILKGKMKKHFYLIIVVEFVLGLVSYFSDFKTVLFFLSFLGLFFITYLRLKSILYAIFFLIIAVFIGYKWTSIKGEYREFLNKGSKGQNVSVTGGEALNKLIDLSAAPTEEVEKGDAMFSFLDRMQYTYHLAKTMDRVPSVLPHEYGGNIANILGFVLMPRALNPDKPIYKATEKTKKYTGLAYAGYEQGASFSLGYFADCYIDFGYVGMFFPLLILGFIFGSTYFYFARRSTNNLLFNYAVVGAIFMEFIAFEADGTYLLGRLFATLLTFFMLKLFIFQWLLNQIRANTSSLWIKESSLAEKYI